MDDIYYVNTNSFSFSLIQKSSLDLNAKYTASVFDGLELTLTCICKPNLIICSKAICVPKISYSYEKKEADHHKRITTTKIHLSSKNSIYFCV